MIASLCTLGLISSAAAFSPAHPRWSPGLASPAQRMQVIVHESPAPVIEKGANASVVIKAHISADDTLKAFETSAQFLGKSATVRGFRKGSKIPTQVLAGAIGHDLVKSHAIQTLSERAVARVQASGELNMLGQPRLPNGEDEYIAIFNPGQPLELELLADVYPELVWKDGYETIEVTVEREPVDEGRIEKALKSMQERYLTKTPAASDYNAAVGDVVLADMTGFHVAADGSKGEALPAIASGEGVEILLEPGQFMPGFVEGLIGAKQGEVKDISVSFPKQATRTLTPELAGKPAIFEVSVKEVMTREIPELDDAFADSVRAGLTYDDLYKEVRNAVGEEGDRKNMETRNKALEEKIVDLVEVEVPETMILEKAKEKFAMMMSDFQAQGTPDDEIKKMITKEGFEKYKNIATPNIIKAVTVTLALVDVAKKNGLSVDSVDIEEQIAGIKAQAEQKNEEIDEEVVRSRVEEQLQRDLVFNFIADRVKHIEWVDVEPELPADDILENAELIPEEAEELQAA